MTTPPPLRLDRQGAVATLVIDRPAKHNAMTLAMWRALPGLVAEADADSAVCVLVLRGAGGAAFSAGADIAEFGTVFATPESARAYNDAVRAGLAALEGAGKPCIAAIEGLCVGGGCGLAIACDLRFAAAGARLGITPARLGLVYAQPDVRRLVDAVGPSRAKDMLFTGRLLDADEALAIGLVDRVAPAGGLDTMLGEYLAVLQGCSQYSIRAAKRMVDAVTDGTPADDPALRSWAEGAAAGEDLREGWQAFLAGRKPRFTWR